MRLNRVKNKDVDNMIKDFDLRVTPYEIKENLVTAIGILLPITTFCVTLLSKISIPLSVMLTAFSLLPSAYMIKYGCENAEYKHMNKVYKADELYNKREVELTDKELEKIENYSKQNNVDFEELKAKVMKMKELKIRRDARDISASSYNEKIYEV